MTPPAKPDRKPDTAASHPETSPFGDTVAPPPESAPPADPTFGPPVTPGELGRLGHYRVVRVLGRGGMGAIYLATDETLGREVALKVMLPSAAAVPTSRERFLREARAAACIEHDHVVAIHHVGEESGVPFIVMPLLKGETLADRLQREGRLTAAEATRVGRETALGLAAAHARGLVHRDVKPANIWLEAGSGRVKVLDFGLARPDDPEQQHLTSTGAVLGTPAYMAPEQAAGEHLDHRADLFSLGCVLYEVATGHRPFAAATIMAVLTKIATHTPPPAATLADVPLALSDLIQRLLAKHPAGRPQTAAGVAELLRGPESAVTQTLVAYVPPAPNLWTALDFAAPAPRSARTAPPRKPRRWAWAAAGGLTGLLAVAFAGVVVLKIKRPDGSETTVEVPDGASAKVDAKGNVEVTLSKVAPPGPSPSPVVPAGPSPLDALDPAKVPPADRMPGLGDALVAAFGSGERAHWGYVFDSAYSPDGKTVATAGDDGVRLWDARTLAAKGHVPGWANTVEFSPDGKTLAARSVGEKVRLIDVTGPEPAVRHTLGGVSGRGAFSPDGRRFHVSHPFAAYDLSGPTPSKVLTAPDGQAFNVGLYRLADGRFLSVGVASLSLAAWDLSGVAPVKGWELTPPAGVQLRPSALTVTPDGKTLLCYVTRGEDKALGVWDVGGKEPAFIGTHPVADFVIHHFAATPDSARVYLQVSGQPIQVYDRAAKTLTATALHAIPLAVSPDGKSLLFGTIIGPGAGVRLNVADGPPNALTRRHPHLPSHGGVSVTADGKWFVELVEQRLFWWAVGQPQPAAPALEGVRFARVNRRGPGVLVHRATPSGEVVEGYDPARRPTPLFSLPRPVGRPADWNGDRLAVPSADGKAVEVWAVEAQRPTTVAAVIAVPAVGIRATPTRLSPDNRHLTADTGLGDTAIWCLGGRAPERLTDIPNLFVGFLPNGRVLFVRGQSATTRTLAGPADERPLPDGPAGPGAVAAGPGDAVAVSYLDGSVWVWSQATNTPTHKFKLPAPTWAIGFAPDGRHLIATHPNATSHVLRLAPPTDATK